MQKKHEIQCRIRIKYDAKIRKCSVEKIGNMVQKALNMIPKILNIVQKNMKYSVGKKYDIWSRKI